MADYHLRCVGCGLETAQPVVSGLFLGRCARCGGLFEVVLHAATPWPTIKANAQPRFEENPIATADAAVAQWGRAVVRGMAEELDRQIMGRLTQEMLEDCVLPAGILGRYVHVPERVGPATEPDTVLETGQMPCPQLEQERWRLIRILERALSMLPDRPVEARRLLMDAYTRATGARRDTP